MKTIARWALPAIALVCLLAAYVSAAEVAQPASDVGLAQEFFSHVMSGEYLLAASAALMLVVWLARHQKLPLVKWLPWLSTKWGGWALSLGLSALGAVGTALASGGPVSGRVLLQAVFVALVSSAGWELKKDVLPAKS